MSKKILLRAVPFLLAPLALTACDDGGSTGPGAEGAAHVSLLLTDAPGDLEAAVVTITDIYLQGGAGEEARGRVYLMQNESVTTDLLSLSNDVVELVDEYEIPAGTYSQLRFVLSGAYIEVETGGGGSTIYATSPDYEGLPDGVEAEGTLKCPSCAQSGLKVLLGPLNGEPASDSGEDEDDVEMVFDGEQVILVDFDVSRSFGHEAGNSGKWIMRPTLKATRLLSAAEVVVTLGLADPAMELPILGDAPLDLGSFTVTLAPAAGGDAKTATFIDADEDGIYEARFGYLFPGEYSIGLVGLLGLSFLTDVAFPVAVDLSQGAETTVDFRLTEISLQEEASVEVDG